MAMGVGLVASVPCGMGATCSWALFFVVVVFGCKCAMQSMSVRVMLLPASWWCCDGFHGGSV
eukprot:991821-Karenia_brevis.AAC.1